MSLTKYLQCTKDFEATDSRDKLYALLGVASDVTPEVIVPDYEKPIKAVFLDLVRFLVTQRGSLDIISSPPGGCFGRHRQRIRAPSSKRTENSRPGYRIGECPKNYVR
ncbi:hypothetical protein N8I77_008271 [Diaporthe amygdali]|uniref:Uncharacterized protein n=1 Tax=Phomopsis amygdali TaxID=1214568 RepID=A0AAD9SEM1_PHOAM|nr:hypothetical protein N8I77_008271 [Diaporthe amygdali]